MRAIIINHYGSREQLKLAEVPVPVVGPLDVLIEVHAAGVNPVDWKIREGRLRHRIDYPLPLILGWDAAGVVKEVGRQVTQFHPGDPVFTRPATERNGAYAEYVVVDESLVAPKPGNITFVEAASVPLAALTAWEGLVEHGKLRSGQRVLIHAGAGGVGVHAIQLAKNLGAWVVTTTSAGNVNFVKNLGADEVIDYQTENFALRIRDLDLVFDLLGGSVQENSFRVLKPGGRLVSIVQPPSAELIEEHPVEISYFFLQPDGNKLIRLGKWIEQGKLRPVVGKVFPLSSVQEAHALSESGHARGKIVLAVK